MSLAIESLYDLIKPHEALLRKSDGWLGMMQLLAPAIVLVGIKRSNSTNGLPVVPFLFMSMLTGLNLLHSQLQGDEALIKAHLTAFSFSIIYLTTYFYFVPSKEKSLVLKVIVIGAGFVASVFFYANVNSLPPYRVELVIRSVLYSYYLLGLVGVIKAFQDQSTQHMPFEMILAGTAMTINKFASNILAKNEFFTIQFGVFLFVHVCQLICFLFFPTSQVKKVTKLKEETKKKSKKTKKE